LGLLVRTWNVFHGRTVPDRGRLELERMVRLVCEGDPAVVALQEVPVWALPRLEGWSGMRVVWAVAMPALGGPVARRVTDRYPRRLRSALVGQANAVLLGRGAVASGPQQLVRLNPRSLRRTTGGPRRARIDWARNRRVGQIVPVVAGEEGLHVVNLHASTRGRARAELDRIEQLLPDGPILFAGDVNLDAEGLRGFSEPVPGVDQILLRGLAFERPPEAWPAARRRHEDVLLSDHAPVEAVVSVGSPAA
jgi:endonuclease/exonuclease/phosphatase family metal-dependent hydrolase